MIFAELFNNLLGIFTRNDNSKYVLKKLVKIYLRDYPSSLIPHLLSKI